ncbi:MAG TPA: hypothetical protein VMT34_02595 [Aggregatilineales bacterium]|nr:hypothetical protein [Aggregatilineales bacterium]
MADLRVVYSELQQVVSTLTNLQSKYGDSITGVNNIGAAIANGGMIGPVADQLTDKLNTISGHMTNYSALLGQLIQAINQAMQDLQAKDQETVGKIPQN